MRIVYGRAHCGKSTDLFSAVAENAARGEKSIIFVPEQVSFRTEARLAENGFFGGLAEVLTFTKLARRTLSAQARRPISACGKTILMQRALLKVKAKLKLYEGAAKKAGMASKLVGLKEEFSHLGIDNEQLADCVRDTSPLSMKLSDLSMIFSKYEEYLGENYIDTDGMLLLCASALAADETYKNTHIYIDEFSDFPSPYMAILQALVRCAKSVSIYVCADEKLDSQGFFAPGANTVRKLLEAFRGAQATYMPKEYGTGALAHFEQNYTKYAPKRYVNAQDEIQIFEGRNPYGEIHFAASEILRLCREENRRFRDFAVCVGDSDRYFDAISYIFPRYGIPFFVSQKKDASAHPLALCVLSALEIAERGFQYDTVFAYLKSGFANIDAADVDFLENYVLATGIGAKHWTSDTAWSYKTSYFEEKNEDDAMRADALRRRVVEPLLVLKDGIGAGHTVAESAQAIYDFMCGIGMREKTQARVDALRAKKDFAASSMYRSIYNGIMHVIEQMAALCGDEKYGIERLGQMLAAGLSGQSQAIVPQRADEVSVLDVAQARFCDCKVMFALGTNSGAFHGFSGTEGILSDADRMNLREGGLSVLPTARHKAFDHRYTVYKTLTAPTERLYICYAMSDMDSKPLSASPVSARAQKLFEQICIGTQDDYADALRAPMEGTLQLARSLSRVRSFSRLDGNAAAVVEHLQAENPALLDLLGHCGDGVVQAKPLKPELVQRLYPGDMTMSVTRLENYSACPFAYFMNYILNARERKINRIGAPDIGNMVHLALEYFVDETQAAGEKIAEMAPDRIRDLTQAVTERVTQEMFAGMASVTKASDYFAKRLQVNLERYVQVLVRHIALGKFEPIGSEIRFGDHGEIRAVAVNLANGNKLKIHGIIDRLDKYETESGTYYRVVDYKTGSKTFSMDNIADGLDFQLMVYMEAALGTNPSAKPGAVMYFKIKEPMLSADGPQAPEDIATQIRRQMRLDGICVDTPEVLEAMDSSPATESEVFKLKYTKDGGFYKNSAVCSMEVFSCMAKRVRRSVRAVGDALLRGEISIMPVRKRVDACKYCAQKAVCMNTGAGAYVRELEDDGTDVKERLLKEGGGANEVDG